LTGGQNIIKYSDILLLIDVIYFYVVTPYWLKETLCALFGVNKSEEVEQRQSVSPIQKTFSYLLQFFYVKYTFMNFLILNTFYEMFFSKHLGTNVQD